MPIELVHIGFDNFVATNRIVAIASPNSASIKRVMKEAGNKELLIDMTHGRKTRSVIFTDSGHIFVTARAPDIIAGRLHTSRGDSLQRLEHIDEKAQL
jgi:hypothetical protein